MEIPLGAGILVTTLGLPNIKVNNQNILLNDIFLSKRCKGDNV